MDAGLLWGIFIAQAVGSCLGIVAGNALIAWRQRRRWDAASRHLIAVMNADLARIMEATA